MAAAPPLILMFCTRQPLTLGAMMPTALVVLPDVTFITEQSLTVSAVIACTAPEIVRSLTVERLTVLALMAFVVVALLLFDIVLTPQSSASVAEIGMQVEEAVVAMRVTCERSTVWA